MPNPYHDAEGKFASKDEMKAAIETAQKNGDFETYFRLRKDLELIESDKVEVSRQFFDKSTSHNYGLYLTDNDDLGSLYARVRDNQEIVSPEVRAEQLQQMLDHENCSDELKAQIYAEASAETKNLWLHKYNYRNSAQGSFEVKQMLGEGQVDDVLAAEVARSGKITFEDKYNYLAGSDRGFFTLALNNQDVVFKTPELQQEFSARLRAVGDDDSSDHSVASAAFNMAAKYSPSKQDVAYVAERTQNVRTIADLFGRKELTVPQARQLLTRIEALEGREFEPAWDRYRRVQMQANPMTARVLSDDYSAGLKGAADGFKAADLEELTNKLASSGEAVNLDSYKQVQAAGAEVDVYGNNFKALGKAVEKARKEATSANWDDQKLTSRHTLLEARYKSAERKIKLNRVGILLDAYETRLNTNPAYL